MKRTAKVAILIAGCLFPALAAEQAAAAGEVWRYPVDPPPVIGPPDITIPRDHLEELSREISGRQRRKGLDHVPEVTVEVTDGRGRPVRGVGVNVGIRFGKNADNTYRTMGATGEDGRLVIRPEEVKGLQKLSFDLYRREGHIVVSAYLKPTGDGDWLWLYETPYKDTGGSGDAGSCGNLFTWEPAEARYGTRPAYRLRFRMPSSLLECEEVAYGLERHSSEYARIDDIGRRDLNAGDSNSISLEDEEKMGLEASREFDRKLNLVRDPEILGYVQDVMDKVVAHSDDPDMPIHLRVVHTDDINAFVTPGGHVYVFTGLIKAAGNESQLAGVLAHEASHAIARHVSEGITRNMKTQGATLLGALAAGALLGMDRNDQEALAQGAVVTAGIVGLKYDRRAETEADLLGAQYLWNAGWDPEAVARFFEVMEKEAGGAAPPGWLSTHPAHDRRVENGLYWANAYLPQRERYLVDTAEFQACKRRVDLLGPANQNPETDGKGYQELLGGTEAFQRMLSNAAAGQQ